MPNVVRLPPGADDLSGRRLGPYLIESVAGVGGMAVVYKAVQPSVDRHVALKVLNRQLAADPEFLARFRREVAILALLKHPHVLSIIDFGEADGYTYLVMPLVEGGTLASRLRGEPLPLPDVRRVIGQVADALDYAHGKGVVHRDIKPSNILLDENEHCLLSDFGIARVADGLSHLTLTGVQMGTPSYMSPEQAQGEPGGAASDVYSLGVVLYELFTGHVPFKADTPVAIAVKHVTAAVPAPTSLNPSLDAALERVVLKALAKSPGDRFSTPRALVTALSMVHEDDTAATVVRPPTDDTVIRARGGVAKIRRPMAGATAWASVIALLVAISIGVTAYLLIAPTPPSGPQPELDVTSETPPTPSSAPAAGGEALPSSSAAGPVSPPQATLLPAPAPEAPRRETTPPRRDVPPDPPPGAVSPPLAPREVSAPPPAPRGPVRVGGQIKQPTKLKNVPPIYPAIAQSARVQGVVILEAVIAPDGRVGEVRVLRSIPLLDQAAIDAVKQWEFTPTLLDGVPVAVLMTVTVQFTLSE